MLEPLATDMAAFRAALGMGVTEIGIIRDAVRAFIDSRVKRDKALRDRYEEEQQKLHASKLRPIRLVTASDKDE